MRTSRKLAMSETGICCAGSAFTKHSINMITKYKHKDMDVFQHDMLGCIYIKTTLNIKFRRTYKDLHSSGRA